MTGRHSVTRRKIGYVLPILSAVCFIVATSMLLSDLPWLLPLSMAIYFLVLMVALERTGL